MPTFDLTPLPRGITQSDVSHAADSLLRAGERPTIERIRARMGRGSPNTINPMLDAWWKTLGSRLDAGPAAFHRLPEVVAHVAESLWMHAQEEARRRARVELKAEYRQNGDKEQALEVRSHVLTLREGELDTRLHDRERTIEELSLRVLELTSALRKEQAERVLLSQRSTKRAPQILPRKKPIARLGRPKRQTLPAKEAARRAKMRRKGKKFRKKP